MNTPNWNKPIWGKWISLKNIDEIIQIESNGNLKRYALRRRGETKYFIETGIYPGMAKIKPGDENWVHVGHVQRRTTKTGEIVRILGRGVRVRKIRGQYQISFHQHRFGLVAEDSSGPCAEEYLDALIKIKDLLTLTKMMTDDETDYCDSCELLHLLVWTDWLLTSNLNIVDCNPED